MASTAEMETGQSQEPGIPSGLSKLYGRDSSTSAIICCFPRYALVRTCIRSRGKAGILCHALFFFSSLTHFFLLSPITICKSSHKSIFRLLNPTPSLDYLNQSGNSWIPSIWLIQGPHNQTHTHWAMISTSIHYLILHHWVVSDETWM